MMPEYEKKQARMSERKERHKEEERRRKRERRRAKARDGRKERKCGQASIYCVLMLCMYSNTRRFVILEQFLPSDR
jgi:hypothetical protein